MAAFAGAILAIGLPACGGGGSSGSSDGDELTVTLTAGANEPDARALAFATCMVGTSCVAARKVPIRLDQEMTWEVKLMTVQGDQLVGGGKVCLVGRLP